MFDHDKTQCTLCIIEPKYRKMTRDGFIIQ